MSNGGLPRADPGPPDIWMEGPHEPTATVAPPARPPTHPLSPIDVVVRGDVPHGTVPYAHNKVVHTMAAIDGPVLHARLKLTVLPDATVERPAVAEAVLDVHGDGVRAHVAGRSIPEAADLLERRLADRLEHRRRRLTSPGPGQPPSVDALRHWMLPVHRPSYVDRPIEERELVRHKSYSLGVSTAAEAVFDMEAMDYDFYLFVELATGEESVVWRREAGYALARVQASDEPLGPSGGAIALEAGDAPTLGADAAVDRLNAGRERFVFFRDVVTGRGAVAYRRFDGDYGLLAAAPGRKA